MTSFQETNSWHWLLMAIVGSLLVVAYPCYLVAERSLKKYGPELEQRRAYVEEISQLTEQDAALAERRASEVEAQADTYAAAVLESAGTPVPAGEQSVLALSNEINRAMLEGRLRIVEQEEVMALTAPTSTAARAAARARAAAGGSPAKKPDAPLPYKTREIRYVVEGEYKDLFMFLVRQSHRKPSYHFKNIQITEAPLQDGMRMEFTLQIHFT